MNKKNLINFMQTILIMFALFVDVELFVKLNYKKMNGNVNLLLIFIGGIFAYKLLSENKKVINNIWTKILSTLFSLFMVFGNSYLKTNSWNLIFKDYKYFFCSSLVIVGYYILFKFLLDKLFAFLDKIELKESKIVSKFRKMFDDHPFLCSLFVIILCWLPYIISFYPVILSPDPSFQIKQFFGIDNKYSYYSVLIDENVIITNHHPVVHTLLLGSCLKIGTLLNNVNFGLFIYSIIQISVLSCTLSFTISYLKKINIPYKIRKIILFIYALVPVFPFYAMSAVKDVIFGSLVILYIVFLYEIILNKNKKYLDFKKTVFSIILMIFIYLFRNNGIYVILLSFPFLFFITKPNRKNLAIILFSTVLLYYSHNNIILPYFKITPGSIREMLSIPFQQTARYVKEDEKSLSEFEKEAIDKILNYDTLKDRYDPEISDPVKNEYNRYATRDDLKRYFKAWFMGLVKRPDIYVQATLNNIYGYFYPNKTSWYIYYKYDTRIVEDGFDYSYNSLSLPRKILTGIGLAFPYIPIIGMMVNIGFNVWLLFIMLCYMFHKKRFCDIIFLAPSFVLLLVCIASPVNTYFRYALPFVFGMPLMIALFLDCDRRWKNEKER